MTMFDRSGEVLGAPSDASQYISTTAHGESKIKWTSRRYRCLCEALLSRANSFRRQASDDRGVRILS